MSNVSSKLTTTGRSLAGGRDAIEGYGQVSTVIFNGSWILDDRFTIVFTDSFTGLQTTVGSGNVTGVAPTFVFCDDGKVYVLQGLSAYFSAVGLATTWNDPNGIGNGFVTFSDIASSVVACVKYQGKLVFIARNESQVWNIDPDPANWSLQQRVTDCGTIAKNSVQGLGELEVMMLADSGVRSLRTRETSLNAFKVDIGSPIDSLVQTLLATLTDAEKATSCSIVEPSSGRYWLFVPGHSGAAGKIYVLSYFPTSQIIAWSTYDATYEVQATVTPVSGTFNSGGILVFSGLTIDAPYLFTAGNATSIISDTETVVATGDFVPKATTASVSGPPNTAWTGSLKSLTQTAFTPQCFVIYNGQVFARDGSAIYAYGGADGNTYDSAACLFEPPWLDVKTPATRKQITGIDTLMDGRWQVYIGTNQDNEEDLKKVYENTKSSVFNGNIPVMRIAPYYKLRMQTLGTAAAKFCSVLTHFQQGDSKS